MPNNGTLKAPLFLRSIKTGKGLIKLIVSLRQHRRDNKLTGLARKALTKVQRESLWNKTDKRCHVCGIEVALEDFHADHVKTHCSGGAHAETNYLPCCKVCNNLRWHYSPEEIQLIMKLGRWMKTQVIKPDDENALALANAFVKHEMGLRKRRKL